MNFQIPRWLHVTFLVLLAVIGVVTTLVAKGDLQIAAPIMTLLTMAALIIHSVDPETAAKIVAGAKVLAVVVLVTSVQGCISSVPTVPVTPANEVQVHGCQSIADTHNALTVGGFVFSGGATALGAVSAIDQNGNDRTAYGITAAILGGLTAVDTAWAALTASQFTSGLCSNYVGPLQAKRAAVVWVPDPPAGLMEGVR